MGVRSLLRAVVLTVLIAWLAGSGLAEAAQKTPPGNPPGNNGRIKVDDDGFADPNNEPHIDGCRLWLEFFGFDTQEQVEIVFQTQPSTGKGDHLLTWEGVVSDDPEAGDSDEDNVIPFNLSEALRPFEPHSEQGYHVKVSWDSVNAPGGEKHKVFWLDCGTSQPGTFTVRKLVSGSDPTPGPFRLQVTCNHAPANQEVMLAAGESKDIPVPMGTACAVSEPDARGAAVTFTESPGDAQTDGQAQVTGDAPAVVTVVNSFPAGSAQAQGFTTGAAQPAPAPQVAGAVLTAPAAADTLPRTGTGATLPLARMGLGALGLGAAALALGRGRR